MAGAVPETAAQVNSIIGGTLRQFVQLQANVERHDAWLDGVNLQTAYNMSSADEADMKSAIGGLNTALQALDMTFINRLTGP